MITAYNIAPIKQCEMVANVEFFKFWCGYILILEKFLLMMARLNMDEEGN